MGDARLRWVLLRRVLHMTDVKRLLAEATPLPWRHGYRQFDEWERIEGPDKRQVADYLKNDGDAALLVYAVNRLPDYEAAVDALVEWDAAENELPLDGFDDDHVAEMAAWLIRIEKARKGAAAAVVGLSR